MSKEIIAFIGKSGSGKDYRCNKLVEQGYVKLAFADALRDIAFTALGLIPDSSQEPDYYLKHYESYKEGEYIRVWDHNGDKDTFGMRIFMERLATEGIRKYDPDFWVRCLISKIVQNEYNQVCISDLRFINEFSLLYEFCLATNYELHIVFCDYRSSRYINNNKHESAKLANAIAELGYKDGQELSINEVFSILNNMKGK